MFGAFGQHSDRGSTKREPDKQPTVAELKAKFQIIQPHTHPDFRLNPALNCRLLMLSYVD